MHVITARCSCPLEWEKHRWSLQIEQTHIVPSLLLINIGIWIHLHHKLTGWTHWELRAQSSSFKNPQLWWTSTCSPGWPGMRTIMKSSGYNISKQRWEKLIKSRELCHTEDTPCKWAFPCPLPTIHQWNELQLLKANFNRLPNVGLFLQGQLPYRNLPWNIPTASDLMWHLLKLDLLTEWLRLQVILEIWHNIRNTCLKT